MKFTKFTTSSLISGLLLGLFSCIDNDYDLNKDINLEISVGGNLSLPIGKTDTIRLSRMIEEGDVLHVIDGKYVINKADNISENIAAIDPVVIDNFAPLCHYTLPTVTNRREGTFRSLRYAFGGDHPSQTTHQTVSSKPRVRPQTAKGPYFKDGSTKAGAPASKPPAYPTHQLPKFNVKL